MARAVKKDTKKKAVPAQRKAAAKKPAPRADLGAPIDGFFDKQPANLRAILEPLRALIDEVAPEAESAIKWGMPFYTLDGATLCALGAHNAHVNLILSGPPGTFDDPHGKLVGDGKTGKHLKLTHADQIVPREVRAWLKQAIAHARGK
jgi:hypothetical protein